VPALTACATVSQPQELALDSIEPASGVATKDTSVQLHGSGFTFSLSNDLDRGTTIAGDTLTVTVGSTVIADAAWRGPSLVEGTVPAGLSPGTYDVVVTMGTRTAMLQGGFEVLADTVLTLGPFGTPALLTPITLPVYVDDDPSLTADLRELYFNSDRPGGPGLGDIWVCKRATTSDPWGTPSLVNEVSTLDGETTPKVSPDGLALYFSSNRAGTLGGYDIWVSTRASRTDPWSAPTQVVQLSSNVGDTGAAVDASGVRLVLSSTRNGSSDLFLATRATVQDPWSTPVPINEANSLSGDADPFLANGGLTLMFISDRPGGMGLDDLYLAERFSLADPFNAPVLLPELNSPETEEDPWITDDLRHVVFTSYRSGDYELYEAFR